jgi:pimeloyl-ACP methyl ester carboxylesterase
MFSLHTLATDVVSINYAKGPNSGAPMVWLHGVSGRWQRWKACMEGFSTRWQQFALDARGHGQSGRLPGRYTWLDHASDLDAFLLARLEVPAVLVGHSLGALQALKVAADRPSSVRALVLEDPPLYAAEHPEADYTLFQLMEAVAASGMTAEEILELWPGEPWMSDDLRREYAESLTQVDPENLRTTVNLEATRGYDPDDYLGRVQCPALVIRAGGIGAALSPAEQDRALAQLSQGSGVTIANCGHLVHAEQPAAYRATLWEFLERL